MGEAGGRRQTGVTSGKRVRDHELLQFAVNLGAYLPKIHDVVATKYRLLYKACRNAGKVQYLFSQSLNATVTVSAVFSLMFFTNPDSPTLFIIISSGHLFKVNVIT